GHASRAVVVNIDIATFVERHFAIGSQQISRYRTTANRNDQLVEGHLLFTFGIGEAHSHLLLLHFRSRQASPQTNAQALLGERLQGFLGNLLVSRREELVLGLDHGDFSTQARPDRTQFEADNPRTNHPEFLRYALELQSTG